MTYQEYIITAIKLADGFHIDMIGWTTYPDGSSQLFAEDTEVDQYWLGALSAQLVSQVDALRSEDFQIALQSDFGCTVIWLNGVRKWAAEGPNRIENIIRIVVDSGVLK